MSRYRTPTVGTVFHGDDGDAVVVEPGTTPLDGLLTLLEEGYGGDRFAADNPAVLEALPSVRVEVWRSCSKAWREGEGVGDEWTTDWWAPSGDGRRQVTVAWYDGSLYSLGEAAEGPEADDQPGKVA